MTNPGPSVGDRAFTYGDEEFHSSDPLEYSEDAFESRLPPWPGPTTPDSSWSDVEARLEHHLAERRVGGAQTAALSGRERESNDAREQG